MRIRNFLSRIRYAATTGSSLLQKLRLFYHTALKPSLAFRGLARYSAARILAFTIKAPHGRTLEAHVRDNGVGMITIAEFFSAHSIIIPADLGAHQPKVIYDLGANVGIASLYFSSLFPKATIYGFEPLPENLEVCALNYQNLPEPSRVFPWAVGAESGTAVFDCQNDSRGGRLESSPHDPKLQAAGKMEVEVYSIGDLILKKGLLPPDILKIDVEGAEFDVLRGLEKHYRSVKWILMETHGDELEAKCISWLVARGFKILPCEVKAIVWANRC
jgi:FkbM family methyltransferase